MSDKGGQDSGEGDSIKVFVRVRPPDKGENDAHRAIDVDETRNAIIVNAKPEARVFSFDKVADFTITQEAVFCAVGKNIIDGCLNGYNGTIFAYGQTGSGKTFTMLGPSEDSESFQHELRGVIPRSFEYLFSLVNREQELHGDRKEFLCRCSFLEIYQEQIYDLLDSSADGLHLRENIKKGVFVDGLREQAVASASEAYQVLTSSWINRRVAATSMNRESSRSHAVFTLAIESKEQKGGVQNVRMSQLNLVDLAGSERQKDTNAAGVRLKEAGSINKSLSTLGNVIMSLVDIAHGKSRHVPYRDSKLTFLLRDSLGGNAKTHIVACVHPGSKSFGETLSTLQFARRAKMIKNKAVVNEDTQGNILHLQAEIRRLKDQILQFTTQGVPKELQSNSTEPSVVTVVGGDAEWRKNFIEAMFFREKTEVEKKNLAQMVKDMDDVAKKREKFNQSREMVMKFREKDIENLKKEITKLKSQLAGDDENAKDIDTKEDSQVVALKEEVKVLTERLKCHPVVLRQNIEIQKLKTELKMLKNNDGVRETALQDNRRIEELDKAFKELMAEKCKNTVSDDEDLDKKLVSPYTTPQAADNISTATLEKFKSQVANLQKELENAKATIVENREVSEKKIIELGAELSSAKQMNEEVMRSLKMRQLHYDIEKKTLNDLHCRTIETITTPQKARYQLRNRNIPGSPLVRSLTPDLNQSIEMEEGITGEDIPEIAHEALTDEIKQLQDSNSKLNERLQEYESDMMSVRQEKLKYENQIEQLNQILRKERSEWADKEEEQQKRLTSMQEELKVTHEEARVNREEVQDLKVMINYTDKEKADLVKKGKESEEIRQKTVESLETQLMKVSMEFEQLRKMNEDLSKDLDMAQERIETGQMTVDYQENCLKELEEKNKAEQEISNKLQAQVKSLEERVEQKNSDVETMKTQMLTDSASNEEQVGKFLEEINSLKAANSLLQNECDARHNNESLLKTELDKSQATVASLEKELAKDRASVASLWNTIQEQKSKLNVHKDKQLSLESQLTNRSQQSEALQATCDRQTAKIGRLEDDVERLQEEANTMKGKFDVESALNQDTMEDMSEQMEVVQQELQDTRDTLRDTQNECESLKDKIVSLTKEMKRKDEEESNYYISNKTILELEELMNKNDILIQEKNETINRLQRDMGEVKSVRNGLEERCCLLESDVQDLHAQLSLQESQLKEKEECSVRAEQEASQARQQCEEVERAKQLLNDRLSEFKGKVEENSTQCQNLVDENKRLLAVATKDREEVSVKHSELEVMKEHYSKCQADLEYERGRVVSLEEEVAKLGGHQNLKQKIRLFQKTKEEKFELEEKNHKLEAENMRLKMDLAKMNPSTPKQTPLQTKENLRPGTQSSHCERTKSAMRKSHGQTLFLSGDYTPTEHMKKARLEVKNQGPRTPKLTIPQAKTDFTKERSNSESSRETESVTKQLVCPNNEEEMEVQFKDEEDADGINGDKDDEVEIEFKLNNVGDLQEELC